MSAHSLVVKQWFERSLVAVGILAVGLIVGSLVVTVPRAETQLAAAVTENERECSDAQRFRWSADHGEIAVQCEQIQISVEIVLGGDSIKNEVEAARVFLHLVTISGDDDLVSSKPKCVILLVR